MDSAAEHGGVAPAVELLGAIRRPLAFDDPELLDTLDRLLDNRAHVDLVVGPDAYLIASIPRPCS